ncbi:hypothetical protein BRCON_1747 [Candidatus Sumerlaea chitinivorans]|uniref:Uncharacterized protein n=1 Tax=Sumerlaea chitinivorans TaxID=2250252 RepID=A0A2Z4Y5S5_SUMC1|nr:hypothetical protein BRCON_1747 [Candidatus Sumerlaea chitinivorans]
MSQCSDEETGSSVTCGPPQPTSVPGNVSRISRVTSIALGTNAE